ncbi:adhesion G-protein coupled receptor G6-like isoform X2 [Octopus vulgaris]|uniref:Adhesion G-protein coupled receptor G6-like isoform X2 n=1 Tax=Octopus vulgaris TaxID=6645 RepID=A0AA36HHT6_OCTVU|nr:adhesion G-protein coupled receptor G6-like isoform X2 [Octopus vulgaris]
MNTNSNYNNTTNNKNSNSNYQNIGEISNHRMTNNININSNNNNADINRSNNVNNRNNRNKANGENKENENISDIYNNNMQSDKKTNNNSNITNNIRNHGRTLDLNDETEGSINNSNTLDISTNYRNDNQNNRNLRHLPKNNPKPEVVPPVCWTKSLVFRLIFKKFNEYKIPAENISRAMEHDLSTVTGTFRVEICGSNRNKIFAIYCIVFSEMTESQLRRNISQVLNNFQELLNLGVKKSHMKFIDEMVCDESTTSTNNRAFSWPMTKIGTTAEIPCHGNVATRHCSSRTMGHPEMASSQNLSSQKCSPFTGIWQEPDMSQCYNAEQSKGIDDGWTKSFAFRLILKSFNEYKKPAENISRASQMEKPGTQGNDDTCPASNTTTEDQRGAMAARKERHPGIDGKQEVNAQSNDGRTPLHLACWLGSLNTVELLLGHNGIDVNVVSNNGDTPLHDAVQRQHYNVVSVMLNKFVTFVIGK